MEELAMQHETQDVYLSHRLDEDRPHILSAECWCKPLVVAVGDGLPVSDNDEDG